MTIKKITFYLKILETKKAFMMVIVGFVKTKLCFVILQKVAFFWYMAKFLEFLELPKTKKKPFGHLKKKEVGLAGKKSADR